MELIHPFLHEAPEYHYESEDGVALHHMQKVWLILHRPIAGSKHTEQYTKLARFDKADKAYHRETCNWATTQGFTADYIGYPCWWDREDGEWERGRVHSCRVFSTKEAAENAIAEFKEKYGS